MLKRIISLFVIFVLITQPITARANVLSVNDYSEPRKIRCTCYVGGKVTANGKKPFYGTVAGPKDWFGCAVAIYEVDQDGQCGDFLGWWEVNDTGPNDLLLSGKAIDMWQESLEDAYDWISQHGDYVYIKLIRAEG